MDKPLKPFLLIMISALVINNLGFGWFALLLFITWILTEKK